MRRRVVWLLCLLLLVGGVGGWWGRARRLDVALSQASTTYTFDVGRREVVVRLEPTPPITDNGRVILDIWVESRLAVRAEAFYDYDFWNDVPPAYVTRRWRDRDLWPDLVVRLDPRWGGETFVVTSRDGVVRRD